MSVGCLKGVWDVSGGCLSDSGYCLGGYDVQAIDKHPIRLIFISCFLFSQLPRNGQNVPYFGVSVGCLEGVWGVSGGCLSDSEYSLVGYDVNWIDKHQIWTSLISCIIFSQWPSLGIFWLKMQNFRSDVEG